MSDRININCGERLSIENVENLYAELQATLTSDANVELDGGQVHFCDTAGLQLIVCLRRELKKNGRDIGWSAISDNLSETAGYLGLHTALGFTSKP